MFGVGREIDSDLATLFNFDTKVVDTSSCLELIMKFGTGIKLELYTTIIIITNLTVLTSR